MRSKKHYNIPDWVKTLVIHTLIAGVLLLWISVVGCPLRRLTGIPCPGCGMTRALLSLFRLDFAAAWYYHPLVFFIPLPVIYLIHRKAWHLPGGSRFAVAVTVVISAALVAVYIWRFHQPGSLVRVDYSTSLIARLVELIRKN